MKVKITRELKIQKYQETEPHIVISIQDPYDDFVELPIVESRKGWIGLKFHDIDTPFIKELSRVKKTNAVPFNKNHAEMILSFYNEWKNKVDLFIIHCVAGVCRSPAVGAALYKIEGKDDSEFFKRYCPNMHVYNTILEVYYEQKEKEEKKEEEKEKGH